MRPVRSRAFPSVRGYKMPCAVRKGKDGKWRYRTVVRKPDGSKERISGTPTLNLKAHAERDEQAHYMRVMRGQVPRSRVYFVSGGDLVKIGFTTDLAARLRGLQSTSPVALTLLGSMPGTVADEHALHERFASLRAHGEWFRRSDELLAFVEENAS